MTIHTDGKPTASSPGGPTKIEPSTIVIRLGRKDAEAVWNLAEHGLAETGEGIEAFLRFKDAVQAASEPMRVNL